MGVVYAAIDHERETQVAIKTIRDFDANRLLRFKKEFRSIQGLDHPNLVRLGELIESEGSWFFTMELINGTNFYRYVRTARNAHGTTDRDIGNETTRPAIGGMAAYDEERLRRSLAQLAGALRALHHVGLVHRDIKPSNIMVTPNGRVVLLDFGIVTESNLRSSDNVVGTAAYMSPEQAASLPVGPASDWYSVGVMLYEVMTGVLPVDGMPLELLMAKQRASITRPSEVAPGIPEDLDDLCMSLLEIRPEDRPDEDEILTRLGVNVDSERTATGSMSLPGNYFVGRDEELGELTTAFAEQRGREAIAVFVHGESGIGKSALVRHFVERVRESYPSSTLILESRCYERESVPFKAFDGVIDALSRYLVDADEVDAAGLIPLHINALVKVFPVLRRAEVVAKSMRHEGRALEPSEMRERVFEALRDLCTRLSSARDVVIVIDDFQWADADSLALLRALLRPPDAPPMLLVATVRDETGRRAPGELAKDNPFEVPIGQVRHLRLHGLAQADATELASHLIRQVAPRLKGVAEQIIKESDGHPLFIDEMIRHGALTGEALSTLQLDTALWARVLSLDEEARSLLELVATANAPIAKATAATAAQMRFDDCARWVSVLRGAKLVQTTGARHDDVISVFHDRVRQAVMKNMNTERRRHCHERIALAMETAGSGSHESLAAHWGGAGDVKKAYSYLRSAAVLAEESLAFDHAAQLYRRCLDALEPGDADEKEVRIRLGYSLANAGRGAEAANAFLAAALLAEDPTELNAIASSHLLRSGHVDSALEVLRGAAGGLGLSVPQSPRSALARLVGERALLRTRGLAFRRKHPSTIPKRDVARVDTTWGLAVGLGLIDTIRGAALQAQHLRLALKTGDPYRIGRALSVEAAYRYAAGSKGKKAGDRVIALAEELADEIGHPNLRGSCMLMRGLGHVCQGTFVAAEEQLHEAETYLRENCSDVAWELSSAQMVGLWASWYCGNFSTIAGRLPEILRGARRRGDLYAQISSQIVFQPLMELAKGRPDLARETNKAALRGWSQKGFHIQHYFSLYAETQIDLYEGQSESAHTHLEKNWQSLKASMLLEVQQNRIEAVHCRGRVKLALASERGGDEQLLKQTVKIAAQLVRENAPWAVGLAHLLTAGVHSTRGRLDPAIASLQESITCLDASDMKSFAAAARFALGTLAGRDAELSQAMAYFEHHHVQDPRSMSRMLAPGIFQSSASS